MRKLIYIFLFFLCTENACAQTERQYSFTHYGKESGLLSTQVNSIVQDNEGFIWIGGTDGLQRFDANRFQNFRHIQNNIHTIPSNSVLQLMLDTHNNLWVLNEDGRAGIFDRHTFLYHAAPLRPRKYTAFTSTVKKLIKDESGNICLLLGGLELLTYDAELNEFSYKKSPAPIKEDLGMIHEFCQQPGTSKYWMVRGNNLLMIYNQQTGHLNGPGNNPDREPAVEALTNQGSFYDFLFDHKHRLWFASWENGIPAISCYDLLKNTFILRRYSLAGGVRRYHEIAAFFEQSDGTIWVRGLAVMARYREKEKDFERVTNGYSSNHGIAYEGVSCIMEDREKNLWIATNNNGAYRFNPGNETFTNVSHWDRRMQQQGEGSPMSFIHTKWNTIICGTWSDGMYHYDSNLNLIPMGIKGIDENAGPFAWSMYPSRDSNTIWLSAQPGIYRINQDKHSAEYYNPPLLQQRTVRQVVEDTSGNLWIGMQHSGLFKWDHNRGASKFDDGLAHVDDIPSTVITKLKIDSKGWLWVGTVTEGLYVLDRSSAKVKLKFTEQQAGEFKLPDPGVSDIIEYNDSLMLISTSTNLLLYNRYLKKSKVIPTADKMSGYISAIEMDKNGFLWISTTNGLYRADLKKGLFVQFTSADGIDNEHFVLGASKTLPDGRMLFGNTNQFIVFNPSSIQQGPVFPQITITAMRMQDRNLRVDSILGLNELVLNYDQNSLHFDFSTLSFMSAYNIMYKLENLDKEWINAGVNNQAIYNYIPSGSYTLLLKTMNESGSMSSEVRKLRIIIKPVFYKTWWFYSLAVLLMAAILFLLDQERTKRKTAIQRMRSNIAGNLHEEVNMALTNINILTEMARIKAGKDIDKSIEYIEQINMKSNHMITAMDDMLWSIDPANDNMQKTVVRMREYIDALNNEHDAHTVFEVDEKVNLLKLDMQFRHEAFILFKESIIGLRKACAVNSRISLQYDKGSLIYKIRFDNSQCDIQQLNNLLHSQDLGRHMNNIGATIRVDVNKSNSTLTIKVPVS